MVSGKEVESMGAPSRAGNGPSVLFICMANICRSPMAAALFRERLKKERADWQSWRVDSAGTWALDGEPAARNSRLTMARRGVDISDHRAKTVSAEMLESYDLILTMEAGQKEAIQVEFPSVAGRVFLLSEMEGQIASIEDPYGGPLKGYEDTASKIDQILIKGMSRIVSLAMRRK